MQHEGLGFRSQKTQYTSFMLVIGMDIKNCAIRRDIKIHDKLTGSQQILVGIQNYNLVLIWR